MSIYQAKHKARGRYGVLNPDGQWLTDFLGDKQQAQDQAEKLNQQSTNISSTMAVKTTKAVTSNKSRKFHFILTKQGWLKTGE